MAPVFGFSAGDFVAAIGLVVKISKALRDTGGASTECKGLIQDLHNLQQILELLQRLRPASGNLSQVNAIRGVALTCLTPLREFAAKIQKSYGSISGSSQARNRLLQTGRKIQWAVFGADEIAKFRALISAKASSIGLLLGFFNNATLSRIEEQNQEAKTYLIAKIAENRDSLKRDLSGLAVQHQQAMVTSITDTRKDIRDDLTNLEKHTNIRHEDLVGRMNRHTKNFDTLSYQVSQLHRDSFTNTRQIVGHCFGARAGTADDFASAQRTSERLEDELKSIRKEQKETGSSILSVLDLASAQLQSIYLIGASLLRNLVPFSQKVLQYLRENMRINLEIYALLLKIQQEMPKQLADSDSIYFEDELGRGKNLPYAYFCHWEIFEAMLRCHFKDLPEAERVKLGGYSSLDGNSLDSNYDKHIWRRTVFPGARIKMRMFTLELDFTCKFSITSFDVSLVSDFTHCPLCNVMNPFVLPVPLTPHVTLDPGGVPNLGPLFDFWKVKILSNIIVCRFLLQHAKKHSHECVAVEKWL